MDIKKSFNNLHTNLWKYLLGVPCFISSSKFSSRLSLEDGAVGISYSLDIEQMYCNSLTLVLLSNDDH